MSPWSVLTSCVFVLALGALVALVDRWRESRENRLRLVPGGRTLRSSARAARPEPPHGRRAA